MTIKIENAAMDAEALNAITKHMTALSEEIQEDVVLLFDKLSIGIENSPVQAMSIDDLYTNLEKDKPVAEEALKSIGINTTTEE